MRTAAVATASARRFAATLGAKVARAVAALRLGLPGTHSLTTQLVTAAPCFRQTSGFWSAALQAMKAALTSPQRDATCLCTAYKVALVAGASASAIGAAPMRLERAQSGRPRGHVTPGGQTDSPCDFDVPAGRLAGAGGASAHPSPHCTPPPSSGPAPPSSAGLLDAAQISYCHTCKMAGPFAAALLQHAEDHDLESDVCSGARRGLARQKCAAQPRLHRARTLQSSVASPPPPPPSS